MKNWQVVGVVSCVCFPLMVAAGQVPSIDQLFNQVVPAEEQATEKLAEEVTELPTEEHAFVEVIGKLDKAKIVELLGEPAKADDVKLKDSGRIVASIWHYHYINTSPEGEYYETTELDFIDDKVNVIVFLNNDGSEKEPNKTYEVPAEMPTL